MNYYNDFLKEIPKGFSKGLPTEYSKEYLNLFKECLKDSL